MPRTGSNLKTKLAVSSFVIVFLLSAAVPAELKLFPMWQRMHCGCAATEETDQFACYDFTTAQMILNLDIDLQLKLDKLESCLKDKIDLKLSVSKLNDASALLLGNISRYKLRLKEKDKVLVDNTNLMTKYQARDVFGGALPWVIAVVAVVAAGAFAGGYYIGSR